VIARRRVYKQLAFDPFRFQLVFFFLTSFEYERKNYLAEKGFLLFNL
jgi:hypothetical protein